MFALKNVVLLAGFAHTLNDTDLAGEADHLIIPTDILVGLGRSSLAEPLQLCRIVDDFYAGACLELLPLRHPPSVQERPKYSRFSSIAVVQNPTHDLLPAAFALRLQLLDFSKNIRALPHPVCDLQLELRKFPVHRQPCQPSGLREVLLGALEIGARGAGACGPKTASVQEEVDQRVSVGNALLHQLIDRLLRHKRRQHRVAHGLVRRGARPLAREPVLEGPALVDVAVLSDHRVDQELARDRALVMLNNLRERAPGAGLGPCRGSSRGRHTARRFLGVLLRARTRRLGGPGSGTGSGDGSAARRSRRRAGGRGGGGGGRPGSLLVGTLPILCGGSGGSRRLPPLHKRLTLAASALRGGLAMKHRDGALPVRPAQAAEAGQVARERCDAMQLRKCCT
mmetsp:Transcript_82291/g.209153  ORF Transcript_82291/g.209153 Transcript_82291/m.209153 type:complete len:397 (+) Transcript_82291:152-1342(+)